VVHKVALVGGLRRGAQTDVRVVLQRLGDRALGLAQGAIGGARGGRQRLAQRSIMNLCASGDSSNAPRSQAAQTTPPAAPEKAASPPAPAASTSPQRAHEASSGANPAASASLSRKASAVGRPAAPST